MSAIICTGDDDEKSYCNACDALLYVRKDGSRVCSNGSCGITYEADKITHHHTGLHPMKSQSDDIPLIPLAGYHDYNPKKKKKEVTQYEDDYFNSVKSGRNVTESYEYLPEG